MVRKTQVKEKANLRNESEQKYNPTMGKWPLSSNPECCQTGSLATLIIPTPWSIYLFDYYLLLGKNKMVAGSVADKEGQKKQYQTQNQ